MAETLTIDLAASPTTQAPDLLGAWRDAEETVAVQLRLADYIIAFTQFEYPVEAARPAVDERS